ncbi:histidine phosphatase family protein [Alteribacillus iranensis]|uniref:Alpha-ribazole phosphatase/uncharacterized phosphatase n=1 Tax=Alteribacillus iranensis TaxID=930128 RepID=A0A1I2FB07_9BACI|nr:histidine phosphatase family protein [Alteribacillus iranensis]SFF02089.1 alpha-ribazole phosphatase/uncharacterized phosphatase [Alteribacillus iranensis]
MEIYLIRHAESMGNISRTIQGCQDVVLTEKGKKQAALLGEYLADVSFDYLYSSDLIRAKDTVKAVEKYQDTQAQIIPFVREINLGPLQGKDRRMIYEMYPQVREKSILQSGIEGTETEEEITERCRRFYELLRAIKNKETAAVVSHGGFLTIFLMYLLAGEEWNKLHRPFLIHNTGISKLSWRDNRLTIHYINQYPHLMTKKTDHVNV